MVDAHQHFWQVGKFDYPWMSSDLGVLYRDYLPTALESILKANGVEKTVLVQASNLSNHRGKIRPALSCSHSNDNPYCVAWARTIQLLAASRTNTLDWYKRLLGRGLSVSGSSRLSGDAFAVMSRAVLLLHLPRVSYWQ